MKVRKRDGRLESFDHSKISNAIHKAAVSVGSGEELLAEELASVVALFLERDFAKGVMPIEDVQEMVERVLMETGHTDIARAFILFRERRERMKEVIQVRDSESDSMEPDGVEVEGGRNDSISPWSKGRIVAALMTEAELPVEMAAEIASEVEARVFQSGLTRISSSLIRELVDNELFNRGLNGRLFRQSILGIPGYDVKRLVESDGEGKTPAEVAKQVAGAVLRQYSLRAVYSPEESDAHVRGDNRIEGLECPSGYLEIDLEPTLLPSPFTTPDAPPEYLASCIRFLEKYVAHHVNVDITDSSLLAYTTRGVAPEDFAGRLFKALSTAPASGQAFLESPVLRIGRSLNERRVRMLQAVEIRGKAAARFMDTNMQAFMEAAASLGRELAIPALHLDLAGERIPEDELITRAVLLESAGRITVGASWNRPPAMVAIHPLVGGVVLELRRFLKSGSALMDGTFHGEVRSHVAMALAALYSKKRFMKKLHLRNRGPQAAIRRFLGGDGDSVGPGYYRLVPACLHGLETRAGNLKNGPDSDLADHFASSLFEAFNELTRDDQGNSGLDVRLTAPWTAPSPAASRRGIGDPETASRSFRPMGGLVELDPLPDDFKGEAEDRIRFIRLMLEAQSERDHVS